MSAYIAVKDLLKLFILTSLFTAVVDLLLLRCRSAIRLLSLLFKIY